jgi:arylsulfatase
VFSTDDLADVGVDEGTPVAESYGDHAQNRFTGRIGRITIEVGPAGSAPDLTNAKQGIE